MNPEPETTQFLEHSDLVCTLTVCSPLEVIEIITATELNQKNWRRKLSLLSQLDSFLRLIPDKNLPTLLPTDVANDMQSNIDVSSAINLYATLLINTPPESLTKLIATENPTLNRDLIQSLAQAGYFPLVYLETLLYNDKSPVPEEMSQPERNNRLRKLAGDYLAEYITQYLATSSPAEWLANRPALHAFIRELIEDTPVEELLPFRHEPAHRKALLSFIQKTKLSAKKCAELLNSVSGIVRNLSHAYNEANEAKLFYGDAFKNRNSALIMNIRDMLRRIDATDKDEYLNNELNFFDQLYRQELKMAEAVPRTNLLVYDPQTNMVLVAQSNMGFFFLPTEGAPSNDQQRYDKYLLQRLYKWIPKTQIAIPQQEFIHLETSEDPYGYADYKRRDFWLVIARTNLGASTTAPTKPEGKRVYDVCWVPIDLLAKVLELPPYEQFAAEYNPEAGALRTRRNFLVLENMRDFTPKKSTAELMAEFESSTQKPITLQILEDEIEIHCKLDEQTGVLSIFDQDSNSFVPIESIKITTSKGTISNQAGEGDWLSESDINQAYDKLIESLLREMLATNTFHDAEKMQKLQYVVWAKEQVRLLFLKKVDDLYSTNPY